MDTKQFHTLMVMAAYAADEDQLVGELGKAIDIWKLDRTKENFEKLSLVCMLVAMKANGNDPNDSIEQFSRLADLHKMFNPRES